MTSAIPHCSPTLRIGARWPGRRAAGCGWNESITSSAATWEGSKNAVQKMHKKTQKMQKNASTKMSFQAPPRGHLVTQNVFIWMYLGLGSPKISILLNFFFEKNLYFSELLEKFPHT